MGVGLVWVGALPTSEGRREGESGLNLNRGLTGVGLRGNRGWVRMDGWDLIGGVTWVNWER